MKKINWKVRIKNKLFWLALIPALLLLIQRVLVMFGIDCDLSALEQQLLGIVEAVFALLAVLGIVVDPTTEGVSDSCQALEYDEPRVDEECD